MPERKESRDWTLFLSDMQLFCSKVMRYCKGLSAEQFAAERKQESYDDADEAGPDRK